MKDSREDGGNCWRVEAPLIGRITISRKILVRAAIVGIVVFSACDEKIDMDEERGANRSDWRASLNFGLGSCSRGAPSTKSAVEKEQTATAVASATAQAKEHPLVMPEGTIAVPTPNPDPFKQPEPVGPTTEFSVDTPTIGDSVVTLTHGPLPPDWSPNEGLQQAWKITNSLLSENPLLFQVKVKDGYVDNKTNTLFRFTEGIVVTSTKGSEDDFRQGRLALWGTIQAGSISATQLGPYRALRMQIDPLERRTTYYYYVPLAGGRSALIYSALLFPPGYDVPPAVIAEGEALSNEAQSIAQGLRFQVNGKPVP